MKDKVNKKKICKHNRIEHNSWGWKCLDCWKYFTKSEVNELKKNKIEKYD